MGETEQVRRLSHERESVFPQLADADYEVTSEETIDAKAVDYNCIAYAAGDMSRKWDCPVIPIPGYYWPPNARRGDDIGALISAFQAIGYEVCSEQEPEDGYEKVALFADDGGLWRHAAKQIEGGQWSSKLGRWEDIRHADVDAVWCEEYGKAACYMRRKVAVPPVKES
jgi:hypothetical protein